MFTNNSATGTTSTHPINDWSAALIGLAVGVAMVTAGLAALRSYGLWLFVMTPFVMGATTAFVYNRGGHTEFVRTAWLVIKTMAGAGVLVLAGRIDGAICIVMATPLAIAFALIGALAGRGLARIGAGPSPMAFMLMAIPLTAAIEPASGRAMHEVQSSVVIDAPPAAVWPHVVAFSDIPDPRDWLFRAGIAYPIRARIEGRGPGAVRYCEFSTGAFVEPITRWEPARRLSFDVVDSPAPMRELSPYPNFSPRHLHGYLRARHGEFRFVDLGDGRTRLEGSTWYELEMAPEAYWQVFSDSLIHRIHQRVLDHIKDETER